MVPSFKGVSVHRAGKSMAEGRWAQFIYTAWREPATVKEVQNQNRPTPSDVVPLAGLQTAEVRQPPPAVPLARDQVFNRVSVSDSPHSDLSTSAVWRPELPSSWPLSA